MKQEKPGIHENKFFKELPLISCIRSRKENIFKYDTAIRQSLKKTGGKILLKAVTAGSAHSDDSSGLISVVGD